MPIIVMETELVAAEKKENMQECDKKMLFVESVKSAGPFPNK